MNIYTKDAVDILLNGKATTSALTTETTERKAADTTLANDLATESSTRASEDTALGAEINAVDAATVHLAGAEEITGVKTFNGNKTVFAGTPIAFENMSSAPFTYTDSGTTYLIDLQLKNGIIALLSDIPSTTTDLVFYKADGTIDSTIKVLVK